jgi:hypothetical protein
LLILVDRVDIEWKKSSSPSGGRLYCCAVENCKVVCLSQEPETGGTPPLGTWVADWLPTRTGTTTNLEEN